MQSKQRSRTAALADRLAAVRARSEELPGAPLVREVLQTERELGGGLIAGGGGAIVCTSSFMRCT